MKDYKYNHYDKDRPSVKLFDNFLNEVDHISYERDYWKSQASEWESKYHKLLSETAQYMNETSYQILTAFLHKPAVEDLENIKAPGTSVIEIDN
jgi:hypothetical protein